MTHFWDKKGPKTRKKLHHNTSGKLLYNFGAVHFWSNLNPIWEQRV